MKHKHLLPVFAPESEPWDSEPWEFSLQRYLHVVTRAMSASGSTDPVADSPSVSAGADSARVPARTAPVCNSGLADLADLLHEAGIITQGSGATWQVFIAVVVTSVVVVVIINLITYFQ